MSNTITGKKFKIEIVYNGLTDPFLVQQHEQVHAVLQQAIHHFKISQNAHLLSLFRQDGSEVAEKQSIADAGILPGEILALRPSVVKGGLR